MYEIYLKAWLERLRDPKSKQHYGALKECSGGRCCLGHLGDILVEMHPERFKWNNDLMCGYTLVDTRTRKFGTSVLPLSALHFVGLPDAEEQKHVKLGHSNAVYLNDRERYTLQQIADEIEMYIQPTPMENRNDA